jgi:hypothetical protein
MPQEAQKASMAASSLRPRRYAPPRRGADLVRRPPNKAMTGFLAATPCATRRKRSWSPIDSI